MAMTGAIVLLSLLGTYTLPATDDVWVYPHAYDQTGDPVLRVWGDGANSVGEMDASNFTFSYSVLRFDVSKVTEPAEKLKKATLVLWHDETPRFTLEESKAAQLEARAVSGEFSEGKWTFEQFTKHMPVAGELALLGKAALNPTSDGKPFKVEIDLLSGKGDFRRAFAGKKAVGIALTTKMAPEGADGTLYEVLSKSAGKDLTPTLVLEYEG
jgi:hypothetical protein